MTLYVKKRIPVEAVQVSPDIGDWGGLEQFTNHLVRMEKQAADQRRRLYVFDYLHNTWVEFKVGDWIVKGIRGEFSPVEETVFAETYEKLGQDVALAEYRPETNEERHGRG